MATTSIIDLKPIQDRIADLEYQLKTPIPTPPVGWCVIWYRRAHVAEGAEIAAIVTKVEGPGKITITAFAPVAVPDPTRRGCLHVSHPVHEQRANASSVNSGAWDYPTGVKPPKEHYQYHIDLIRANLEEAKSQLRNAAEIKTRQEVPAAE